MSKRRKLHFETLADALADAEANLEHGYQRLGNWSLGQMCDHLSRGMTHSRDGFPKQFPRLIKWVTRRFALKGILDRKVFQLRYPAPIPAPGEVADEQGVERLAAAIKRFEQPGGKIHEHPVLGVMTPDQWTQFQLWHCEHHLSYLLPIVENHD